MTDKEAAEAIDPTLLLFANKGYVPRTKFNESGMMAEISWEQPQSVSNHLAWAEAFVIIALLIFVVLVFKGVPW